MIGDATSLRGIKILRHPMSPLISERNFALNYKQLKADIELSR